MKEVMAKGCYGSHSFSFNEKDNGGEQFCLQTDIYDNGDDEKDSFFLNQELTLCSYGNSATFNLSGVQLTPELLRKLANELDEVISKAKAKKIVVKKLELLQE